jgi:hypothetical protein
MLYIVSYAHFTCVLTITTKIYEEKQVGLGNFQKWYHHIPYLKSTKS